MERWSQNKDRFKARWWRVACNINYYAAKKSGCSSFCWTIFPYPPLPLSKSVLYSSRTWVESSNFPISLIKYNFLYMAIVNLYSTTAIAVYSSEAKAVWSTESTAVLLGQFSFQRLKELRKKTLKQKSDYHL